MRKKGFKGRCAKRMLGKCAEMCRTYEPIQYAYAGLLQASDEVVESKWDRSGRNKFPRLMRSWNTILAFYRQRLPLCSNPRFSNVPIRGFVRS